MQKKHSRSTPEDETDANADKTFVSTVAEIFSFIGSDPDKAVCRDNLLQCCVPYYSRLIKFCTSFRRFGVLL